MKEQNPAANMTEEVNPTAAAQPFTPNPVDAIHNSATPGTDVEEAIGTATPQADDPETLGVTALIDPTVAERILHLCNLAITSSFYMNNPKRVAALEAALVIPVADDKSFQQFYTHSEKDLLADAYRTARKDGGTPAEVTNAQIMAEAHKRYFAKHQKRAVVNEEYEA